MNTNLIFYVISALMIVGGLAGLALPALPGLPLVFLGMLLAAWTDQFAHIGWPTLLVLGAFTTLSVLADLASSALGAKQAKASTLAVVGSFLGAVVGLLFGLPGIVLGPVIGAMAGELIHAHQLDQAARVGLGTGIGLLVGMVLKIGLAAAMIATFLAMWLV